MVTSSGESRLWHEKICFARHRPRGGKNRFRGGNAGVARGCSDQNYTLEVNDYNWCSFHSFFPLSYSAHNPSKSTIFFPRISTPRRDYYSALAGLARHHHMFSTPRSTNSGVKTHKWVEIENIFLRSVWKSNYAQRRKSCRRRAALFRIKNQRERSIPVEGKTKIINETSELSWSNFALIRWH